jgi:hypothetical protein
MKNLTILAVSVFACLFTSGCVVGRRTVSLNIPTVTSVGTVSKGTVAIKSVNDGRRFENKPTSPSTPSIDGDVNDLSAEQRKAFIGRQRNGFGRAMGDIILPSGNTVETETLGLVREGFARRGYEVVPSGRGDVQNTVEVNIDEFWAWFTPGFATISFESNITCKLTIKHGDEVRNLTITGHGRNVGQIASDANWALAYSRGFADFLTKLDAELGKAGL